MRNALKLQSDPTKERTGCFPKLRVENIWSDDLFEATLSVLFSDETLESIVNNGTAW